jgi:Rod binding domain-containing protein
MPSAINSSEKTAVKKAALKKTARKFAVFSRAMLEQARTTNA